jgi:nucleotide-binding universal stress UspA family protein
MSGITVGVDGSHHAHTALDWAMAEAALRKVPLTVITVNEVAATAWTGQPIVLPEDTQRLDSDRQAAEELVTGAAKRLSGEQPQVTITPVSGFPANVLIDASASADLLVVGNRGGGGFPKLALGATASKVVHHAHCPVVVVHSAE